MGLTHAFGPNHRVPATYVSRRVELQLTEMRATSRSQGVTDPWLMSQLVVHVLRAGMGESSNVSARCQSCAKSKAVSVTYTSSLSKEQRHEIRLWCGLVLRYMQWKAKLGKER